jgi:hypothetical protein
MVLPEEYGDRGVKLTTHLQLVPRLIMNGDIFLLPQYVLKARRYCAVICTFALQY